MARGNYWAGHVAFDVNRDGIADSPYRPNDSIDRMTWSQPTSRLLLGSPAVQMIRWAQSRFPGLLPGGVIDSHPLMSPAGAGLDTQTSQRKAAHHDRRDRTDPHSQDRRRRRDLRRPEGASGR